MARRFPLKKLEEYEEMQQDYPKRIHEMYDRICERLDEVTQEEVKELIEMAYREGLMDGLRFYAWLVDRTY